MLLRDRGTKYAAIITASFIGLYIAGCLLRGAVSDALPSIGSIPRIGLFCEIAAMVAAMAYIIYWAIYHKLLSQGPRYAATHALTLWRLRRALLDVGAGYVVQRYSGAEKVVALPRIKLSFEPDMLRGVVRIRNHIKYNTDLEHINLSSALGRYIVINQYLDDSGNWYIFNIMDSKANRQLEFDSYERYITYCRQNNGLDGLLVIDRWTTVPLRSMLLVGETGSGKTYALYSLILQLLNWHLPPVLLYFADPKNSSLYVMGQRIAPDRTAEDILEIISLLEQFHAQMQERKVALKEKLMERLDSDYRYWRMPAHVFIFDEYASFQGVVNTLDKTTRDKVAMLMRNIVLQGRQLGFFLWIVMQKSGSNDIPTAIRDNLLWKVVLGNATNTTYITTFEHASDLPKYDFQPGYGLHTCQGLANDPEIIAFPTLKFDILAAAEEAGKGPPVM